MDEWRSCSTFTHQYSKEEDVANKLVFIDLTADTKQPAPAVVKEERPPTPQPKPRDESRTKSGRERLQCSECSRICYSADQMTRHLRKHRGENPFQCVMCEYSTYNKTLFQEHVNTHMGVKPYQCSFCDYRSVSKKYTKKHESRHATCDQCGHVARNVRKLQQHKQKTGCKTACDELPWEYKCHSCNICFRERPNYVKHVRSHKSCSFCGEMYITSVLMKHLKKKHGVEKPQKKKKFECKPVQVQVQRSVEDSTASDTSPSEVDSSIDITLVKTTVIESYSIISS